MDAERASTSVRQHLKVAARLGRLHHPETEFLSGYFKIRGIRAGDLQKDPSVWPSLVSLPGGMKEAGTEADASGHPGSVANQVANRLEYFLVRLIHLVICQQREVIT